MSLPENPIATAEQHEHESRAVRAVPAPRDPADPRGGAEVLAGCLQAVRRHAQVLRSGIRRGHVRRRRVVDEHRRGASPSVITISRLPHRLGELQIPGSRWGIDNPDSIYRVIPIDGAARYVIRGRVAERRLVENYFTLWDDIDEDRRCPVGHDLALNGDGEFEISVDATARPTAAGTTSSPRQPRRSSTFATSSTIGRGTAPIDCPSSG